MADVSVPDEMSAGALPPLLERALRILPAVLYLTFSWFASDQAAESVPGLVSDKVAHFGEYGLLALLLAFAVTGFDPERITARALLAVAAMSVAWGALDEYHQSFVPTRDSSLADLAADVAGTVAGVALVAGLAWRERVRS